MAGDTLLDALVGDAEVARWFGDDEDVAAMLRVESALAESQASCGLIPPEAAAAIADACASYVPDWDGLRAGMARDGVAAPALVAALRAMLDETQRRWLHLHATSQDLVDTSLTLRLRGVVDILERRLGDLIAALEALATRQGGIVLMGHTRMQRALPITAADKVATWIAPLQRHRQALGAVSRQLLVVQWGGPVGIRPDRGAAVAAALAARLGLGDAPCWHTGRDRVVAFGQWFALLCGSLGKVGQDIALLAQNELGAVRLAAGGGSSAMPHKSNPVAAEILVSLARFAAGQSGTLAQALVHENERSGAAWTLEWMLLPGLATATGAALRHALTLAGTLRFVAGSGAEAV